MREVESITSNFRSPGLFMLKYYHDHCVIFHSLPEAKKWVDTLQYNTPAEVLDGSGASILADPGVYPLPRPYHILPT